jgi:hypothetical protein
MSGFLEVIQEVWNQSVNTQDAILQMHVKLIRTTKALNIWKRQNLGSLPLCLAIAKEALLLLDTAQEQRQRTPEEIKFRHYLKAKANGLAAIQRTRARQHSRLTWIRKGDACPKLFMLHANNRKRKCTSPSSIQTSDLLITTNKRKKQHMITSLAYLGKRNKEL